MAKTSKKTAKKKPAAKPAKKAVKKAVKKVVKKVAKKAAKAAKPAKKAAKKVTKAVTKKITAAKKEVPKVAKTSVQKAVGKAAKTAKAGVQKALKKVAAKVAPNGGNFMSPLGDRVLLARTEASDRTPGGLYIPDSVMDRPNKGKVLAVGPGTVNKKGMIKRLDVQVGDVVLIGNYAGQSLEFDGTEYLLVREDEILGIVQE